MSADLATPAMTVNDGLELNGLEACIGLESSKPGSFFAARCQLPVATRY